MIKSNNNKHALRKHFREVRSNLTNAEKQQAAINIAQQLLKLPAYQKAQHIGVYAATPEEASLDIFCELAWEDEKSLYLPVIDTNSVDNQMFFQTWHVDAQLSINSMGIFEPNRLANIDSKNPAFDILLIPLVAYDSDAHRLGMGGGFYDRYIEKHINKNCVLIGVAFSCQKALELPHEAWDKKLHALVNEKEIIYFN